LDKLDAALVKTRLDPRRLVIVSDIGCSGLSDQYFVVNAFHGLHGRAVTYASGMKLTNPGLCPIVVLGDGGCGIGGHHLLNAARRNIGLTVLVFNNFNYGMTGGQVSVTTPPCGVTATTPGGNLEYPMDVCATVAANGATFVARATAFDKDLPDLMAEAIQYDGFALIDIWELCTAYYVPNNRFSKTKLLETMTGLGFAAGVVQRCQRAEYSHAYRETNREQVGKPVLPKQGLVPRYASSLDAPRRIVIAGSAGQKVRSTARLLGLGGVLSGLWVTQRHDYPVTVMTGHSVAELILSPEPILYTGILKPDVVILLSEDGRRVAHRQIRAMAEQDVIYSDAALLPIETDARIIALDLEKVNRKNVAVAATARFLQRSGLYPLEAFRDAIRLGQPGEIARENLEAAAEGNLRK